MHVLAVSSDPRSIRKSVETKNTARLLGKSSLVLDIGLSASSRLRDSSRLLKGTFVVWRLDLTSRQARMRNLSTMWDTIFFFALLKYCWTFTYRLIMILDCTHCIPAIFDVIIHDYRRDSWTNPAKINNFDNTSQVDIFTVVFLRKTRRYCKMTLSSIFSLTLSFLHLSKFF